MKEIGFEIENNISLDEIEKELLEYRKKGIYAFCNYNGTKIKNDADDFIRTIDMLRLNMNEEEYNLYTKEKTREKYINIIINKRLSTNTFTRFWIDSVCSYLPDELKVKWEYECYEYLLNGTSEETINIVGFIITTLFEEKDEIIILDKIRFAFLSNNNQLLDITYFLKEYAPNQELLNKYVYKYTDGYVPFDFNYKEEFAKYYNYLYRDDEKSNRK